MYSTTFWERDVPKRTDTYIKEQSISLWQVKHKFWGNTAI